MDTAAALGGGQGSSPLLFHAQTVPVQLGLETELSGLLGTAPHRGPLRLVLPPHLLIQPSALLTLQPALLDLIQILQKLPLQCVFPLLFRVLGFLQLVLVKLLERPRLRVGLIGLGLERALFHFL